jgi:hydroxyethylthiazole kinase-like uncharacterized protein yjeF
MITSKQMKELEEFAESKGVTTLELMENAGKQFVQVVKSKYESQLDGRRVIIFTGCGNNGGDGFVAARYFAKEFPVIVLLFGDKEKMAVEAKKNFLKLDNPITIIEIKDKKDMDSFHFQQNVDLLLIDSLLGMGVSGDIREPISFGVDLFNSLNGIKVAVDIPSGINPDTGELSNIYCESDLIVTFHDIKQGLEKLKNKTVIVDIGIPQGDSLQDSQFNNDEFDDEIIIEKV